MQWGKIYIYVIVVIVSALIYQFNFRYHFREGPMTVRYDRITENIEIWDGHCECWKTYSNLQYQLLMLTNFGAA